MQKHWGIQRLGDSREFKALLAKTRIQIKEIEKEKADREKARLILEAQLEEEARAKSKQAQLRPSPGGKHAQWLRAEFEKNSDMRWCFDGLLSGELKNLKGVDRIEHIQRHPDNFKHGTIFFRDGTQLVFDFHLEQKLGKSLDDFLRG